MPRMTYCKECTLHKPLDGEGRCAICAEVVRSLSATQPILVPVPEQCTLCGMHTKCQNCELWGHP